MVSTFHMLDYIHESPDSLETTLFTNQEKINRVSEIITKRKIDRIILTGVGSSYTAAMIATPLFTTLCPLRILTINSDEILYYSKYWFGETCLVIGVSRSGERSSVIDALELAKKKGSLVIAVTGVVDSLLAQKVKIKLITQEGPEISFPKTKSVITCAGLLMSLALGISKNKENEELRDELFKLPEKIKKTINTIEPKLINLMDEIIEHKVLSVIGNCSNYGVALEAAVKVQEAAYVCTRGDSVSGLLQGPIGALNQDWLVLGLIFQDDLNLFKGIFSLIKKFKAHSLCVIPESVEIDDFCDYSLKIPYNINPFIAGLVYLPVVQLLTYYWTIGRGMNPDKPTSMNSILNRILPVGRKEPEFRNKNV